MMEGLLAEIKMLKEQNEQLEGRCRKLKAEIEALIHDNAAYIDIANTEAAERIRFEGKCRDLEAENERLKRLCKQRHDGIKRANGKNEELRKRIADIVSSWFPQRALNDLTDDYDAKVEQLQKEYDESCNRIYELARESERYRLQAMDYKHEIEQLQKQVDEMAKENMKLKDDKDWIRNGSHADRIIKHQSAKIERLEARLKYIYKWLADCGCETIGTPCGNGNAEWFEHLTEEDCAKCDNWQGAKCWELFFDKELENEL